VSANPPLRLAFLADPNSVHTRRWVGWFGAHGHDVRLLVASTTALEPGLPTGVSVERLASTGWLGRRAELRRLLRRLDSQVLHAHYARRFGWTAAESGFRPLVVTPWGSDILRVPARAVRTRWLNRFALRSASLVTVSSERMRAAAIEAGAPRDRVTLVHHGVDTAAFAPAPSHPAAGASPVGRDPAVILSPRAIRPLYRQEVVVDAVAQLVARGHDLGLVLSARGADPATLAGLRRRATAGGIGARLRVIDDVAHGELPDLLRLAAVVVSVPESDSFPVTVLEAMACGRPIVASDLPAVGPVLRSVDPEMDRFLVPVGDATATASAIERALAMDRTDAARLGARLRAHVMEHADYDTSMARMEALYRQLASAR
jgi:glycosyltransferase involved in cell wall biosynthesis